MQNMPEVRISRRHMLLFSSALAFLLSRYANAQSNLPATASSRNDSQLLGVLFSQDLVSRFRTSPQDCLDAINVLVKFRADYVSGKRGDQIALPIMSSEPDLAQTVKFFSEDADTFNLGDPKPWALGAKTLFQIASIAAGTVDVSKASAVALAALAAFVEPTLSYLASPGLNLMNGPQPPFGRTVPASVLLQAIAEKTWALCESDPAFLKEIKSPIKTRLGIDFGISGDMLSEKAPVSLIGSAKVAVASPSPTPDASIAKEIRTKAVSDISVQKDAIVEQVNDRDKLFIPPLESARIDAEDLRQTAETLQNMQATATIAASLLSIFGEDPKTTRDFSQAAGAIIAIASAFSAVMIPGASLLVFSASVVGATATMMSIGDGPNPSEIILSQLKVFQSQLLQTMKMINQLAGIEIDVLQIVQKIAREQTLVRSEISSQFRSIERLLQVTDTDLKRFGRDNDRTDFLGTVGRCRSDIINGSLDNVRHYLVDFNTHGCVVAKKYFWSGPQASEQGAPIQVASDLGGQFCFASLPGLLDQVKMSFSFATPAPGSDDRLVNPIEWAEAISAFLQTRLAAPSVHPQDESDLLGRFWAEGARCREAAQVAGSFAAVRAACDDYIAASNDFSLELQQLLRNDENASFVRLWHSSARHKDAPSAGELVYTRSNHDPFGLVIDNDPLDFAVSKNLLSLDATRNFDFSANGVVNRGSYYQVTIRKGPTTGSPLIPGKLLYAEEIDTRALWRFNPRFFGRRRVWDLDDAGDGGDPVELLTACANFIRATWDLPNFDISPRLDSALNNLKSSSSADRLVASGARLRLFATISRWRRSPETREDTALAMFANVPIAVTFEEHRTALEATVQERAATIKNYPYNFLWSVNIRDAILDSAKWAAAYCLRIADGLEPEKGIPIIEATLAQLLGYLKLKNMPLPSFPPPHDPKPLPPPTNPSAVDP